MQVIRLLDLLIQYPASLYRPSPAVAEIQHCICNFEMIPEAQKFMELQTVN